MNLANDGLDVVVVSKDLPLRVKAASVGLAAEEYRAELAVDSGYTGLAEIDVSSEQMTELYDDARDLEPPGAGPAGQHQPRHQLRPRIGPRPRGRRRAS